MKLDNEFTFIPNTNAYIFTNINCNYKVEKIHSLLQQAPISARSGLIQGLIEDGRIIYKGQEKDIVEDGQIYEVLI